MSATPEETTTNIREKRTPKPNKRFMSSPEIKIGQKKPRKSIANAAKSSELKKKTENLKKSLAGENSSKDISVSTNDGFVCKKAKVDQALNVSVNGEDDYEINLALDSLVTTKSGSIKSVTNQLLKVPFDVDVTSSEKDRISSSLNVPVNIENAVVSEKTVVDQVCISNVGEDGVSSKKNTTTLALHASIHKQCETSRCACQKQLFRVQLLKTPKSYVLNCTDVADKLDLNDLRNYLQNHLEIAGEANNYGDKIKFEVRGLEVLVVTAVYVPKKTIKSLARKYLISVNQRYIRINFESETSYKLT